MKSSALTESTKMWCLPNKTVLNIYEASGADYTQRQLHVFIALLGVTMAPRLRNWADPHTIVASVVIQEPMIARQWHVDIASEKVRAHRPNGFEPRKSILLETSQKSRTF